MSLPVPNAVDEADHEGRTPPSPALEFAVIACGGAIGAWLRLAISTALGATSVHPAIATATANLIGSFLLGLVVAPFDKTHAHPLLRPFLAIGVFGSFTTFSALSLDHRLLASEAGEGLATAYAVGSIAMGLLAFVLGRRLWSGLGGWEKR